MALIVQSSQCSFVITSSSQRTNKAFSAVPVVDLAQSKSYAQVNPGIPSEAHNLAYVILYFSSTGVPKGVLIEHGAVINYALWFDTIVV